MTPQAHTTDSPGGLGRLWAARSKDLTARDRRNARREADELLRKIQFEALAIGFGAAFIANVTLAMVQRLTGYQVESGDLFLIMVVAYMVGLLLGTRRYA